VDHVIGRGIGSPIEAATNFDLRENPFVTFRRLFTAYDVALAGGMSDSDYCLTVRNLDAEIAKLGDSGFVVTPLEQQRALAEALGGQATLWVKDETENVSGSHKARHLMGIQVYLDTLDAIEPGDGLPERRLAIASCGNAALAAAFIARAANRQLDVYVPPEVDPNVESQLLALDATLHRCIRQKGEEGDPCYLRFKEALSAGALPYGCQGSDNGLTIEGGETLSYELACQLAQENAELDRLLIQVGGGALASATIQGLRRAKELGVLKRLPQIHTVQTAGASPMHRAYDRFVERIGSLGLAGFEHCNADGKAQKLKALSLAGSLDAELEYAAHHRNEFMWPWEDEPHSLAHGILDDETYDWLQLLEGMLMTGGYPLTVDEELIVKANRLAREHTNVNVDPTGSSGLAGLVRLYQTKAIAEGETIGLIFSGVLR
jgi:threonine synthase